MTREEIRRENARRLAHEGGGQTEFGRLVEMDRSQVSQIIGKTPKKNIGNSIARRIEIAFNKPEGWLDQEHREAAAEQHLPEAPTSLPFIGRGTRVSVDVESEEEMIPIKKVTLQLEAGFPGFEADRDFEDGGFVSLPRKFIEQHELVPQCLIAIRVRGASMEPMFFEDDVVVVNIADTRPVSGNIYAINFEGQALVKQMIKAGPDWWLHSFNPAREYGRVLCRGGECIVIGKIIHQGPRSLIGKL